MSLDALIVYEDARHLVVDKPAGVPTAGDTLDQPGSLQHALMARARRMVWAIHQLDRDTSGLNLFVTRKSLVAPLSEALKRGEKSYLALTGPLPEGFPIRRLIDEPIGYLEALRRHGVTPQGKRARTRLEVLARSDQGALLRLELLTGRTHQIRAHLEHLGLGLLGDQRYASAEIARLAPRQMLHACSLKLDMAQERRRFFTPAPEAMAHAAESLGLSLPEPSTRDGGA